MKIVSLIVATTIAFPSTAEEDFGEEIPGDIIIPFTVNPTEMPTGVPTEMPTAMPTGVPTEMPTALPTGVPTEMPTALPTNTPTPIPTYEKDTAYPTITPTKVESGLYFPNCFTGEGGPAVCIVDVGKYELPSATPFYTSLEDCCRGFYAWNYDECMGNGPSNRFFPNWAGEEGSPNVCILDDGTHSMPKGTPKYDTVEECCDSHYSWNHDACMSIRPSNRYFPNWNGDDQVCLADNGRNIVPPNAPMFDNLASCCDSQYSWNLALCNAVDGPSNRYFPNWEGVDHTCFVDNGRRTLPYGAPLYNDLSSCCEDQYSWALDECNSFIR